MKLKPANFSPEHIESGEWRGAYLEAIRPRYEELAPHLPREVETVVDIGCGLAVMDYFLYHHYQPNQVTLHLIDGDDDDADYARSQPWQTTGYVEQAPRPWKSRQWGKRFLALEGIRKVVLHPPDPELTIPCDLIISLYSWGFHYPLQTYFPFTWRSLRHGGRFVVDLRKKYERKSLGLLCSYGYRPLAMVYESRKQARWVCAA